jgi:hypothetical protein
VFFWEKIEEKEKGLLNYCTWFTGQPTERERRSSEDDSQDVLIVSTRNIT